MAFGCENLAREFECVTWHLHFRHSVRRIFATVVMSLSSPKTRDINGSCLFKTQSLSQNKDFLHETNTNCNMQSVNFSILDLLLFIIILEFGLRGSLKMYHSFNEDHYIKIIHIILYKLSRHLKMRFYWFLKSIRIPHEFTSSAHLRFVLKGLYMHIYIYSTSNH